MPSTSSGGFASWGVGEWLLILSTLTGSITAIIVALRGHSVAVDAKTDVAVAKASTAVTTATIKERLDRQGQVLNDVQQAMTPPPTNGGPLP